MRRTVTLGLLFALALSDARMVLADDSANVVAGHEIFNKWCYGCHAPSIKHAPDASLLSSVVAGTYTLEQRYHGIKPAALEERTDLTPALIESVVRHGRYLMPRTRKTEVSDAELADVVAYLTRRNP